MRTLKERINSGETVHGCWINLGSAVSAEIVGRSGFDWVLIDLEHGAGDTGTMYQQIQVLHSTESTVIVRIDELSRSKVQRILDAGATGIMFPQFKEKEEAELAVKSMYYPPKGFRGMARMIRATGFGAYADNYMASLDQTLINIIQIETVEAIRNIDSIASTEGVDVLFVGPNDLSLALGVFGQFEHPLYQQAIKTVSDAAQRTNKTAGVLLQDIREYEMYSSTGYRFLACGGDAAFVSRGAKELSRDLQTRKNQRLQH